MHKIPYKTDKNNPAILAYSEAVEKGKRNQHILPYGKKWAVAHLASGKIVESFSTQNEAINFAKARAALGTAVFIHGSDGRIQTRHDY